VFAGLDTLFSFVIFTTERGAKMSKANETATGVDTAVDTHHIAHRETGRKEKSMYRIKDNSGRWYNEDNDTMGPIQAATDYEDAADCPSYILNDTLALDREHGEYYPHDSDAVEYPVCWVYEVTRDVEVRCGLPGGPVIKSIIRNVSILWPEED
jgi:hypothetical protein